MYLIGHNSSRRRYLRYSAISRYENSRCYWRIFCIKGCVEMFDLLETYRERYSLQTKRGKKKEEYHRSIFPRFSFIFSWCSPCAIRIQRITSFFFFFVKKATNTLICELKNCAVYTKTLLRYLSFL